MPNKKTGAHEAIYSTHKSDGEQFEQFDQFNVYKFDTASDEMVVIIRNFHSLLNNYVE